MPDQASPYPRQIAQVGSLHISAQNEIYDNLPKALKEALFTTAKLVWAEDTDCDEANGQAPIKAVKTDQTMCDSVAFAFDWSKTNMQLAETHGLSREFFRRLRKKAEEPRFVANLGDINPLDHGGAFLFHDSTGLYAPDLVVFNGFKTVKRGAKVTVSLIQCPQCTYINGVLSDNKSRPDCAVWYAHRIKAICVTCDVREDELIASLCSEDVRQRGRAYQTLVSYFGPYEFDQRPEEMTRAEIRKCWRGAFRK